MGAKGISKYFIDTLGSGGILGSGVWLTCMAFDGFRFYWSFLSRFFSFLWDRARCGDCVDVFEGFFYGSFFMSLVSSIVALWILSAWVIVGVWTMWWLNGTVLGVISAPVLAETSL